MSLWNRTEPAVQSPRLPLTPRNEVVSFYDQISYEYYDWRTTQGPEPEASAAPSATSTATDPNVPLTLPPRGLPPGWTIVAAHVGGAVTLTLAQRLAGGWVVIAHGTSSQALHWVKRSLADLYESLDETAYPNERGWLKDVLCSMYDRSDPVEAAEQMMVALGGPLVAMPRAALLVDGSSTHAARH